MDKDDTNNMSIDELVDDILYAEENHINGIIKKLIAQERAKADIAGRINSLLDLERWIRLHNLDAIVILDGIEHMCLSLLQSPNQRFIRHDNRIDELKAKGDKGNGLSK